MRWPHLVEFLEEHPEQIALIGPVHLKQLNEKGLAAIPVDLQQLFRDDDVDAVVNSAPTGVRLDAATIRQCARTHV